MTGLLFLPLFLLLLLLVAGGNSQLQSFNDLPPRRC